MVTTVTSGDLISKLNLINSLNTNIKDFMKNQVVWHNASYPPNFPVSALDNNTTYPFLTTSDITGTEVDSAEVIGVVQTFAQLFTAIRKCHYLRYKSGAGYQYNQTQVTRFKYNNPLSIGGSYSPSSLPALDQTLVGTPPANLTTDQVIDSIDMNTFIDDIRTELNTLRDNTVTITYYYCHSSCHTSH